MPFRRSDPALAMAARPGPAPVPSARGFDMLRWFAALSLVCVLVSAAGTAIFLSRFLTEHMLQRDAEVAKEYIGSIVRAERSWSYFAGPPSPAARDAMESFFNHVAQLPGVVRANVFAPDGTVIWSSNPALIGRRFEGNHDLEGALLRGRIAVESGVVDKAEHVGLDSEAGGRRWTETYLPLWDEGRRNVIGVVEIYRLPDALFRAIDKGVRLVWTAAGLSAALLYAALLWIALQARCAMARQQQRVTEAEALAAVGAVASAVAHGIRNPLASIRSSAELATGETPEGVRECLADIQREADRVERWVRDLLLQARGEAVAPGAVDVSLVLDDTARSFDALAQRQGVALRRVPSPASLPPVRADAGALGQAVDNLVANAIEAMIEGGTLGLSAAPTGDGRAVEIRVSDTGPGLPPHLRGGGGRLFYSTKPRGTGLGLVLTRRIVERLGGTLRFEVGSGGRGTTALIRLPVAPAPIGTVGGQAA